MKGKRRGRLHTCQGTSSYIHTDVERVSRSGNRLLLNLTRPVLLDWQEEELVSPSHLHLVTPNLWVIAHVKLNESDWYPAFLVSGSGIHHLHIWHHTDRMNEGNVKRSGGIYKQRGDSCKTCWENVQVIFHSKKNSLNFNFDYTCTWSFRVNSRGLGRHTHTYFFLIHYLTGTLKSQKTAP